MNEILLNSVRDIYAHLGDEESRECFANRLMYSLTGDRAYLTQMIKRTKLYKEIFQLLAEDRKPKYIFGVGVYGKALIELYEECGFEGFVDNYATEAYKGYDVISLKTLLKMQSKFTIYISTINYYNEIYEQLLSAGIEPEYIVNVGKMMADVMEHEQYFELPYLSERREIEEVFVDGGCFDGKSSQTFVKWAKDSAKKVYAFELDKENALSCRKTLGMLEAVEYEMIEKGLYSTTGSLGFLRDEAGNGYGSKLETGKADITVPVTCIDDVIKERVTFIKMDIEGAEYEALKGAENNIKKYKPKLAICVYHKPEDIWEIANLILEMDNTYRFYIRHYSLIDVETVLYAV